QSVVRLPLALVLAVAPLLAGVIGAHRFRVNADVTLTYSGAQFTFVLAAVLITAAGAAAYRHMDDRPGESLREQLSRTSRTSAEEVPPRYAQSGIFIALEGGEGAGKSLQAKLLARWLRNDGYEVVSTHEPGDTAVGSTLRSVLLDPATGALSDRTEALLYAADKAEHVDTVIAPALARGAVVITDRYVDSTLAYQGAGRALTRHEVERVARWATGGLRPHLTVLLDVDATTRAARAGGTDRLEALPADFHERVRESFLDIAAADPEHYLVVDGSNGRDAIAAEVRRRVEPLLEGARKVSGVRDAP
ncbi:MAG: dTMP kinase, partial [Nocardioidaceae bacterium]|nr:dTMP kinase [Nocardioidaceae bacterium]